MVLRICLLRWPGPNLLNPPIAGVIIVPFGNGCKDAFRLADIAQSRDQHSANRQFVTTRTLVCCDGAAALSEWADCTEERSS